MTAVRWCTYVAVALLSRIAVAESGPPGDTELLPIDIPASIPGKTTLAADLENVCESLKDDATTLVGVHSAAPFSEKAVQPWYAAQRGFRPASTVHSKAKLAE